MSAERRILSPMVATALATALVGAATLGGTLASEERGVKADRFQLVEDQLCEGQVWPNLSDACLVWVQGNESDPHGGFTTIANHDAEAGSTTLLRVRQVPIH